jgi:hypothetical protein
LYSELSYDELKGVLENWLNPSAPANGTGNPVNEALEAPKAQPAKVAPQSSIGLGGTSDISGDLPWEDEAPKAAPKPKDDVASAFDDLFNN